MYILGIIALFVVVFFVLFIILFPPIEIVGSSMYPTYDSGEIIFARRLYRKSRIRVGDVFVFRPPYDMGETKILIKRVAEVKRDSKGKITSIFFVGDNKSESYDSRDFGYVRTKLLIAKIINQRVLEE